MGGVYRGVAPKSGKGRPLRTFAEMAEEFGLKPAQLRAFMGKSKHAPPMPRIQRRCAFQSARTYYDPRELRAWWIRHNSD